MADEHVSQPRAEHFLRAGLSRQENQEVVRHLLAECARCSEVTVATSLRGGVAAALSRFGGASDVDADDPARYSQAFASLLGAEAEAASRPDDAADTAGTVAPAPLAMPAAG